MPGSRGCLSVVQGDPLLKARPEQTHGGREMAVQGQVQDLMRSSKNSDGLRVRLRKLLGYICAEAEEALIKGRRRSPRNEGRATEFWL